MRSPFSCFVYFLTILCFVFIGACNKREKDASSATVQKDCTGTYIRVLEKDYQVCNESILAIYESGKQIQVTYKNISDCPALSGKIVCMMYHEHEGLVEITSVNP